jgi:hypothetical protein
MGDNKSLILIPKCEIYIEYMINVLNKLPRIEKFNIGNNFKCVMYEMIGNVVYLSKVGNSYRMHYCNLIDSEILIQRIYIRVMYKNKYIDEQKYKQSIKLLDEIGRILGGYIKSLGVNYVQKS